MRHTIIIKEKGTNKSKAIGRYDDLVNMFSTTRNSSKHLLRNRNAWSIDYKLFTDLLLPYNSIICIKDVKKNILYQTKAKVFEEYGEVIEYNNHRTQICLNLEYFTKEKL